MYNENDEDLNAQVNINMNRIVEIKICFVTLCHAFKSSILTFHTWHSIVILHITLLHLWMVLNLCDTKLLHFSPTYWFVMSSFILYCIWYCRPSILSPWYIPWLSTLSILYNSSWKPIVTHISYLFESF